MKHITPIMKNGNKHDYPYLHFVFEDGSEVDLHKAEEILSLKLNDSDGAFIMIVNDLKYDVFCTHCQMQMPEEEFERRLLEWHNG